MRIGIHSGSVLCGVLGLRKWQFDIWSHDVIVANRMESTGIPGRVHISESTSQYLGGKYKVEETNVKQKDLFFRKYNIKTYLIKEREPLMEIETVNKYNNLSSAADPVKIDWIPELPFRNLRKEFVEDSYEGSFTCFKSRGKYRLDGARSKLEESILTVLPGQENIAAEIENNLNMQFSFLNRISLTYKNKEMEKQYSQIKNDKFKSTMFCYFSIWLLLLVFHVTIIEMDQIMTIVLPVTTIFVFLETVLAVAENVKQFPTFLQTFSMNLNHNRKRKCIVIAGIITIMAVTSSLSLISFSKKFENCKDKSNVSTLEPCLKTSLNLQIFDLFRNKSHHDQKVLDLLSDYQKSSNVCYHPEYVVFAWTICLIAVVAALTLHFLIKLCVTFGIVATCTIVSWIYKEVFIEHEDPIVHIRFAILPCACFLMAIYHGRLMEATSRVYFLWKQKAESELKDMETTRYTNMLLLQNVLPEHVAKHFLSKDYKEEELYSQFKDGVGVIFASIPNFSEHYTEDKGLEHIRLLNEIIADFDELLDDERFVTIEKIKTVSATATYMAVSGLNPEAKDPIGETYTHLGTLVDFALSLRQKLDEINRDSFNTFNLRVGISYGSLVCGVIGAKKPIFDVWGDTVNEASRMDSTGIPGLIQVSKNTAQLLVAQGFEVKKRGVIKVKGKGLMETYFVIGKKLKKVRSCQRHVSHHNSLGSIVHTIAQNRKKFISHSYRF